MILVISALAVAQAWPSVPLQDRRQEAVFRSMARRYGEGERQMRRRAALYMALEEGLRSDAANAAEDAGLKATKPPSDSDLTDALEAIRGTLASGGLNPLIGKVCRERAAERSFAHWVAAGGDEAGLDGRRAQWRSKLVQTPDANMADYLTGLVECAEACLAPTIELLSCHVLRAATLEHRLVRFDYNDPAPNRDGLSAIEEAASKLQGDEGLRAIAISRTPKPNRPGSMGDALRLASRRLARVTEELKRSGADEERITGMTLGWQEPQLNETIIEIFGYRELQLRFGGAALNRSVQIIFYRPEAD